MWLPDTAVKRPVFATVLSLLLVSVGIIAFQGLPTREYPSIIPPVVSIQTTYRGASAEVVETRITQVLEGEISGLEGINNIRSRSSDGRSAITVEFDLNRNIDEAANDIRDRVGRAARRLPENVDQPVIAKQDSDARPVIWLSVASPILTKMDMTDYVERYVVDRLAVISGVSNILVTGGGRPSIRIYLDRLALAARNLSVTDVESALKRENIELPAGRLESSEREFTLRVTRGYSTAEDFRQLVITQGEDSHLIRLGEVAEVERMPEDIRRIYRNEGGEGVSIGVIKVSTANTVEVIEEVKRTLEGIQRDLPPDLTIGIYTDDSIYIRAAINAVYWTIGITIALVGIVILLFLGDFRSMLIPMVTIPVCLVSSFTILALFGYSINLITLLALVLCIGLVVDDSIVVLENIHRRIELGEHPLVASINGTKQVGFAVIATTVVLVAVFSPIILLTDNMGQIFSELAVTVAGTVIISTLVALSLTPMMCSKLLVSDGLDHPLAGSIDRFFERLAQSYQSLLTIVIRRAWASVAVISLLGLCAWALAGSISREYAPTEDQRAFFAMIVGPEGTSVENMRSKIIEVENVALQSHGGGDVERFLVMSPAFGGTSPSSGVAIATLVPWEKGMKTTPEMMAHLQEGWQNITDLRIMPFIRSGLSRQGGGLPVQFVLKGLSYEELAQWREIIVNEMRGNPGFTRIDSDLKETQPQMRVDINRDRAGDLGVSVQSIGSTLESMLGEKKVSTYVVDGEEYDIIMQAKPEQRATPTDLYNIYVRSDRTRQLIPLSNLIQVRDMAGASSLNRYNRSRSVTISANLADTYARGQALEFLEDVVDTYLPETAQIDYRGESLEYKESSSSIYFTFGLVLLVLFLVLAAQFESFVHPVVILIAVPLAVVGGLAGLFFTGVSLNIYSQIGLIIVIGIAAKNGILIVEFINQLRDEGREFEQAILEASRIRLRPVLMTSMSTLMGSVPLILATGSGSNSRTILGIVLFFGVAFSAFLSLFIIPSFYRLLAKNTSSPNAVANRLESLVGSAD